MLRISMMYKHQNMRLLFYLLKIQAVGHTPYATYHKTFEPLLDFIFLEVGIFLQEPQVLFG